MANTSFTVNIRGIPENPAVVEVNVRSGPNTNYALLFKSRVGTRGLPVLEVRADDQNANLRGKTYQWLRCAFPDGQTGWVRDDLVDVQGDGTRFGYPVVTSPVIGYSLARNPAAAAPVTAPVSTPPPAPAPSVPAAPPAPTPPTDTTPHPAGMPAPFPAPTPGALDRVRRAAFAITAAFEGSGYDAYQTYDKGIVSYGRFQFTLESGSFATVISRYTTRGSGATADALRAYLPRINAKDQTLRQDGGLRTLCVRAANDPLMRAIQDEIATESYWNGVIELSILPRDIKSALGYALLFDMSIQHGRYNFLVPKAETELGVPNKSRLVANGISEQAYLLKLATLRRDNLYQLADRYKLPGLRTRGDFWLDLTTRGDWNLQGDTRGNVNVNGRLVQVREPA